MTNSINSVCGFRVCVFLVVVWDTITKQVCRVIPGNNNKEATETNKKIKINCGYSYTTEQKKKLLGLLHSKNCNVIMYKIQKHFQNVVLVGMAGEISKNY